jgi:hypothetical protein
MSSESFHGMRASCNYNGEKPRRVQDSNWIVFIIILLVIIKYKK